MWWFNFTSRVTRGTFNWWLFTSFMLVGTAQSQTKAEISAPSMTSPVVEERVTETDAILSQRFAQVSSIRNLVPIVTAVPDMAKVAKAIAEPKIPLVIGIPVPIPELAKNNAIATNFRQFNSNDGVLFGLEIYAPAAKGLRVGFLVKELPEEVTIAFFTSSSDKPVATPVTGEKIKKLLDLNQAAGETFLDAHTYWSPIIEGERATVMLHVPSEIDPNSVKVTIPQLSFIFQHPITEKAAGSCNLDVNCYAGYSSQAESVARMIFSSGGYSYLCTGSLLNDLDTTTVVPYFLSANHCISTQSEASSVQTHWFYQSATCNGTTQDSRYTVLSGGATLLYASGNTDTSFMRLNENPPSGITYLGWTTTDLASNGAVTCIHHPSGDWKKISFGNLVGYADCISSGGSSYSCSPATVDNGEFLDIRWNSGVTEGGSSGSMLINSDNQVVGQLYGGGSYCSTPYETDQYGRFNVAYNAALSQWLSTDPVNGSCGPANGGNFSTQPTTGLCSAGTASAVTGTGPWNWTCDGTNGGSTASCSANLDLSQDQQLTSGTTLNSQNVASGEWKYYYITVPAGATNLTVATTNATGDADLYTQFSNKPTGSSYICRPYLYSGNESCSASNPSVGRWWIGVFGFTAASYSITATIAQNTDFIVTAIAINPTAPIANGTFNATVTVKNQGTVAADGGQLRLWFNQPTVQICAATGGNKNVAVGTLGAGASKPLTFTGLNAGAIGIKTLRAFVDATCASAESNETNNQRILRYRVTGRRVPDLIITNIVLTPAAPARNTMFNAAITVKNQGTNATAPSYLDVWTNRATAATCGALGNAWADIGALAAGASTVITLPLASGAAGSKTLRAFVDSWCEITESNEANNQLIKAYTVQ